MRCSRIVMLLCFFMALSAPPATAKKPGKCTPKTSVGSQCSLPASDLRPTQFAVGSVAVDCKAHSLEKKSRKKLKKYLARPDKAIPVVVGPEGDFYMADHHHLATALYRADSDDWDNDSKLLHIDIIENLHGQAMSRAEFWGRMQSAHRSYNYDNKGTPNMNFELLPEDVSGLLNDPYRTLSRWVRESCGYVKKGKDQCAQIRTDPAHEAPFFMEFYWGNFFRQELPLASKPDAVCQSMPYSSSCLTNEVEQLKAIYDKAMALAASARAKQYFDDLPLDPFEYGYNPSGKHLELEWSGAEQACEEPVRP